MADRQVPYGAFNFVVSLAETAIGGFSEVSGLNADLNVAQYRAGNDPENHVQKVPGMHTVGDVTLRRGIIDSKVMLNWMKEVQREGYARGYEEVTIKMMDETNKRAVMTWKLKKVLPKTYNGPSLNATSGEELAMEEWVLSVEGIEIVQEA